MSYFSSKRVVVTGANRGIGLALTQHLLNQGATVVAGARAPQDSADLKALSHKHKGQLVCAAVDVREASGVEAFVKAMGGHRVDVLINNAGINVDAGRSIEDLAPEAVVESFVVNAVGPFRLVQALLPALHASPDPKVVNISSIMGSVAQNESGGNVAYRMSKSAVNMFTKCLAIEQKRIVALTMHPGWVRTRMGGESALIDTDTSAQGILKVIAQATAAQSGHYLRFDGEEAPW